MTFSRFASLVLVTALFHGALAAQTFTAPGSGAADWVYATTVYNGDLIAGGAFTWAGGVPANHIAKWNGSSWSALGPGLDGAVWGLTVYNGQLIAVGDFVNAGGINVNFIAAWNGSSWNSILSIQ